jgi:predicted PurR-regulated permease PerM
MTPLDSATTASLTLSTHQRDERARFSNEALRLIAVCLTIITLIAVGFTAFAAREFLFPIAIAFLLSVMTSPIARKLECAGLWPGAAAGIIVISLMLALGAFVWLITPEFAALSEQLPRHIQQIERNMAGLRETITGLQRATEEIQEATQSVGAAPVTEPVVVQDATPLSLALTSAARIGAQTVATLLLMYFLLAQRRRMKTIIVAMARNHSTRKRLIEMFRDIKTRISTYLLAITLTSVGLGIASGAALELLGFPNPWMWGFAVTVLNFIPYAGPVAIQVAALIVGALTYSTVWPAVLPAVVLWGLNFIEGQIVTPHFVAKGVVLNPLAVFISIVFGGWIWGIVGAVVAVPALIIGASVIQHWWAPCATNSRAEDREAFWRGWAMRNARPTFRTRRAGLVVRAPDYTEL